MAIVRTTVTINGHQYDYTYSDAGRYVVRDGVSYDEAYDPLNSGRVYTEGEIIATDEEADAGEVLDVLLGGSDD